jgi:hypothetical protein
LLIIPYEKQLFGFMSKVLSKCYDLFIYVRNGAGSDASAAVMARGDNCRCSGVSSSCGDCGSDVSAAARDPVPATNKRLNREFIDPPAAGGWQTLENAAHFPTFRKFAPHFSLYLHILPAMG